ncbi:MAG TPA: hypothetical protein VLB46_21390 [Pyrinomonadaceae bacterium]|nr:hypothetical protein [Pyrinomonadaceae bacterium]
MYITTEALPINAAFGASCGRWVHRSASSRRRMGKIDDPIEQIEEQYFKNKQNPAYRIAKFAGERAIQIFHPEVAWILNPVLSLLKSRSDRDWLESFARQILELLKTQGTEVDRFKERICDERIQKMILVALERSLWGANEKKVLRFAAVVAGTATKENLSDVDTENAVSFIRALDELSENDLVCLKHLYNHQKDLVNENHNMGYNDFMTNRRMETMLLKARELGLPMDEIYSRWNRLSGYGLALELNNRSAAMGNPDDFCFRMTLLGKNLIELLRASGESMEVIKKR